MRRIDPNSSQTASRQVANALRDAIRDGEYQPGARLPSRSELAEHFAVAPMTVQNALRELKDEGLLVSRQGTGVFVRTDPPPSPGVAFEHVLTVYASHDHDDAGVPLQECSACGALVMPGRREKHADWHRHHEERP